MFKRLLSNLILSLLVITAVPRINFNAGEEAKNNSLQAKNNAQEVQLCYRWVSGYSRRDGTYVRGYWRDNSNDGYLYNNANYIGLNGHRRRRSLFDW